MKKVLVFGVFDGLHPGHIVFFRQAKAQGDFLVVAVGRDEAVRKFKGRFPMHSLAERIRFVRGAKYVDKATAGDARQGSYEVVLREKPDIICLGYDQQALVADLEKWLVSKNLKVPLQILKPHRPDKYHSSIING